MNAFVNDISFCSGVLGLFIVFPLVALARKRSASLWLALYLLMISVTCLGNVIVGHCPDAGVMLWWVQTCLGPFYYCYIRAMVGLGNGWRQAGHFVPLAVYWAVAAVLLCMGPPGAVLLIQWGRLDHSKLIVYQELSGIYVLLGPYRLAQYGTYLREHYSSTKDRDLTWLTKLSLVLALLWLDWVLAGYLRGNWWLWHAMVCLATFFFVGWYGLRQAAVFVPMIMPESPAPPAAAAEPARMPLLSVVRRAEHSVAAPAPSAAGGEAQAEAEAEAKADAETETEAEKYARSGMTEAAEQLIGERLARRMAQQRDYLESDLRLTELAERVGTTPQLLSQYINRVLGSNFFDYINGLRIAEVQRMMRDPAHAGSTLLELAHAAGFNSKSTFNTYFKNISGMAPSNWRSQYSGPVARAG